jgi:hypothetical protein
MSREVSTAGVPVLSGCAALALASAFHCYPLALGMTFRLRAGRSIQATSLRSGGVQPDTGEVGIAGVSRAR